MGKIDTLKSDVDEVTKKFEDCQDAYATELFTFMSREQLYTEKLLDVSRLPFTVEPLNRRPTGTV